MAVRMRHAVGLLAMGTVVCPLLGHPVGVVAAAGVATGFIVMSFMAILGARPGARRRPPSPRPAARTPPQQVPQPRPEPLPDEAGKTARMLAEEFLGGASQAGDIVAAQPAGEGIDVEILRHADGRVDRLTLTPTRWAGRSAGKHQNSTSTERNPR